MKTYKVLAKLTEKFNSEKMDVGNISIVKTNNNDKYTNNLTIDYRIKILYVDDNELIFYQIRLDGKPVHDTTDLDEAVQKVVDLLFELKDYKVGDIVEAYGEFFILVPPPGKIYDEKFMLFSLEHHCLLEPSYMFNKKELYNSGYLKVNRKED